MGMSDLSALSFLGCLTLIAMFLSGAYRTGETARACLFIFPFLLFPIALYLDQSKPPAREKNQLAALVFSHAVIMQAAAFYFW